MGGVFRLNFNLSHISQKLTLIYLLFLHYHTANVDYTFQNSKKSYQAAAHDDCAEHPQLRKVIITPSLLP